MKLFPFIFIFLALSSYAFAQETKRGTISGIIKDSSGRAQTDVLVVLVDSSARKIIRSSYTDSIGGYSFKDNPFGDYRIRIETGFEKAIMTEIFSLNTLELKKDIQLSSSEKQLDAVVISIKKPFIEKGQGKLTMNVDNSLTLVGQSVFEAMEKAPGVRIDMNDVISLNGRTGIRIQINGKNTPLAGADLSAYLRGIPVSSVEKIEFITHPGSKNDAAGTSLINIILKKDQRQGTNGSISASYGQGIYPKASSGIQLNHRNKKIVLTGNYSYAYRKSLNLLELNRTFYEDKTFLTRYQQVNYLTFPSQTQVARFGMEYSLNKKSTIGLVLNGLYNGYDPLGNNVSQVLNSNNDTVGRFRTINNSSNRLKDLSTALSYKLDLDTLGSTFTIDADLATFRNRSLQAFTTRYYGINGSETNPAYLLNGDITGKLDLYALKSDVVKHLDSTQQIEFGIKSSFVEANNKLLFTDVSSGIPLYDSTKSNHFIYKENINAAYASYSLNKDNWGFQAGLRLENTRVTGLQVVNNETFDTSYTQLFPSLGANYTFSDKHRIELNYARRIDRPSYDQLNPFKFYLDPSTYRVGNPFLKPQSTHGIDFSYVFKSKYITTLGVARTIDNITEVIAPLSDETLVTVQTNTNLKHVDIIYLNLNLPITITKWWESQQAISGYLAQYSGNVANTALDARGKPTFNIQSTHSFKINKTFSAEFRGEYRFREIYAYDIIKPIWTFSTGFQAKILKQQGSLRFNFTDFLYSNIIRADVAFTDYTESFVVKRETRVATLAFTYRFGNSKVQGSRRNNGGAEDLKRRAGSSQS